jgi:iron(III) transport system substrate-binding protein
VEQVCAAGEKEGVLNVRKTTDPDAFAKEVEPFKAKYPGIKISFVSMRPQNVVQQVLPEIQAGRPLDVDVVDLGLDISTPFIENNLVADVDWSALGIPEDLIVEANGVSFFRTERELLGLVYNEDKVNPADLPSTWEELIDSKWAGKVVADPRATSISLLSIVWGKDKTVDWYKRFLSTDKPLITTGESAGVVKVGSGEAVLTTSAYDATVREQQAAGAPVDIKYLDIVGAKDHYAVILNKSPHPNAARCFLSWWGSPEGQAQQLKVEYKENLSKPDGLPASAKLAAIADADQAASVADVANTLAPLAVKK